jgi:hypothetical protein
MKITIYTDKEKTQTIPGICDTDLSQYLIITSNELWKHHWQVIQYGEVEIRRERTPKMDE